MHFSGAWEPKKPATPTTAISLPTSELEPFQGHKNEGVLPYELLLSKTMAMQCTTAIKIAT